MSTWHLVIELAQNFGHNARFGYWITVTIELWQVATTTKSDLALILQVNDSRCYSGMQRYVRIGRAISYEELITGGVPSRILSTIDLGSDAHDSVSCSSSVLPTAKSHRRWGG